MQGKATGRRRERVEPNIYRRVNAAGRAVFEVGYRDSSGKQRWMTVAGGITAARSARNDLIGRAARREPVSANPRLRFGEAADIALRPCIDLAPRDAGGVSQRDRDPPAQAMGAHPARRDQRQRRGPPRERPACQRARRMDHRRILGALGQVFRYAMTRLGMARSQSDNLSRQGRATAHEPTPRRRIYKRDELAQTLASAQEPMRTLFALAAVTGLDYRSCSDSTWDDVDLEDVGTAGVRIEWQIDRAGERRPLKTDESRRSIELPSSLAAALKRHKLAGGVPAAAAFVFATRSGRPLSQRNVLRSLRTAQARAIDSNGRPTFPALVDAIEAKTAPPRDAAPTFHGFRHSAASLALASGESAEEVSWQLGHKNSVVTRAIYVQELRTVERSARRRARMASQYEAALAELAPKAKTRQRTGLNAEPE